jgi:Ca2+-binding RTX toxin-like protein
MSLLSRNTGGRRVARTAAVTAGTLLVWLVVSAIPAAAVTTCSAGSPGGVGTINVGTDDKVVVRIVAGAYELSINGGAFAACGLGTVAATDDLLVIGSDAGNETFTFLFPDDFIAENNIVDLGNGADSLILEYGGLTTPVVADPGSNDDLNLGTADGGTTVGDLNFGGQADLRVDDAETLIVNGGNGNDLLDAGNFAGMGGNAGVVVANDIPAAADPLGANLTLNGGNGDDFLVSGNGNDNFQGGPGADGVSYEASAAGVTVDLTASTGTGMGADTLADVQDAFGSAEDDTITGNSLDNELFGDDGDDTIDGVAGNDIVDGEGDDDTVTGGDGNDDVSGGDGDDVLEEGAATSGADSLHGDADEDALNYGARTTNTIIRPGAGAVSGQDTNADGDASDNPGDERDSIDTDIEQYITGSGNDTHVGAGHDETFTPGAGDDSVDGNGGIDTLDQSDAPGDVTFDLPLGTSTGNGADTFADIESAMGGDGNDTVIWDGIVALVNFNGGDGVDTVDASSSTANVNVNLSTIDGGTCAAAVPPTCQTVENATGGSGNNILTGNVLNNTLIGNDGNDNITAGTGNDTVEGGQGNDILNDGGGADVLTYRNAPAGVTVDTANGFASGGDGEDTIGCCFETVLGSDFNDDITGGQTAFDLPNTLKGFGGNDAITGTNSTDTIRGGAGNDELRAGGGDDLVAGSGGNDLLIGSNGDDRLKGGGGNDHGVGGKGFDVCKGTETEQSCEA